MARRKKINSDIELLTFGLGFILFLFGISMRFILTAGKTLRLTVEANPSYFIPDLLLTVSGLLFISWIVYRIIIRR